MGKCVYVIDIKKYLFLYIDGVCMHVYVCVGMCGHVCGYVWAIDIKKVDKQLTHAMHVKDRHVNDTFIDKLTKWYQ